MYFLSVDLGTTGCKCMMFDHRGGIVAQDYIEYEIIKVCSTYIEQDARQWWNMVKQTVKQTVKTSGVNLKHIKSMSVSSQGISFVPIDISGHELYNAISWLDTRADAQVKQIQTVFTEDFIFNTTGKRISAIYTLPKLMWMKENLPQIYNNTYKFLMGLDYITWKLTGQIVTDYSMASGTLMFNIVQREWNKEILNACGIDMNKLPQVRCAGSLVGVILPGIADDLGLDPATTVMLGAQDQKCAALGAGIKKGVATVSLGTATAVSSIYIKPIFDTQMRIPCFALDQKRWILESAINTSGVSLKWLKKTWFKDMDYVELCLLAQSSPIGANGLCFYPHLEGASAPYWRNDIKGFIYGLTLSTSRADTVRGLLEGVAFQIRINIDMQELIGRNPIKEIRLFGGGSGSELWGRIIADITGKTVSILFTPEIANLGAACFAGLRICNCENSSCDVPLIKKQCIPVQKRVTEYNQIFKTYNKIQDKLLT